MALNPLQVFDAASRVSATKAPRPFYGCARKELEPLVRPLNARADLPGSVTFLGSRAQLMFHLTDILREHKRPLITDEVPNWTRQSRGILDIANQFLHGAPDFPALVAIHQMCWMDAALMDVLSRGYQVDPRFFVKQLPIGAPLRVQFSAKAKSSDLRIHPSSLRWECPDGVSERRHGFSKVIECGVVRRGRKIWSGTYREQIGVSPPALEFEPWHRAGIQPVLDQATYRVSRNRHGMLQLRASSPDPTSRLWAGVLQVSLVRMVRFVREQFLPGRHQVINEELSIAFTRQGAIVSITASRHRFGHNADDRFHLSPAGCWLRSLGA